MGGVTVVEGVGGASHPISVARLLKDKNAWFHTPYFFVIIDSTFSFRAAGVLGVGSVCVQNERKLCDARTFEWGIKKERTYVSIWSLTAGRMVSTRAVPVKGTHLWCNSLIAKICVEMQYCSTCTPCTKSNPRIHMTLVTLHVKKQTIKKGGNI